MKPRYVTIELYSSNHGANQPWRWRMKSNGRIVGASTESYTKRSGAIRNLVLVTGIPIPIAGKGGFEATVTVRDRADVTGWFDR